MDIRVFSDSLKKFVSGIGSKSGELFVVDFYTSMVLRGRAFQVRAGTITTPLTGDVEITDTAAEMCVDAANDSLAIMPVFLNMDIEALGGTLPHVTAKSVATVSSAGAAFTPLNLRSDGPGPVTTARVAAAGGVTVTAELATTTLRHFAATLAAVGNQVPMIAHTWWLPPVLRGPRCFYVQVGSVTTGSTYFGHFEYLELLGKNLEAV